MKTPINILLVGPSGAGKGTQAKLLAERYDLRHLQSGELLRKIVAKDDEFGRKVKDAMQKGFVPSEWIFKMIKEEFSRLGNTGVVIDGFSRKLPEIEMLYDVLGEHERKLNYIFLLELDDEKVIDRLINRRVCSACKKVFDSRSLKDKNICPLCGEQVYTREDDNLESIKNRLGDYKTETSKVIDFIKNRDSIIVIDGDRSINEVFEDICDKIK
ncbi:MAG: nucleoside monophosphate kinase [Candidatus Pacebacteria bacterium]|nr:nucleoside monophosphate kinase [Candidatus Paceibacterota bacterium]